MSVNFVNFVNLSQEVFYTSGQPKKSRFEVHKVHKVHKRLFSRV